MEFEKTIDLPSCGLLDGSRKQLQIGSMTLKAEKAIYSRGFATEKLMKVVQMCSDATYDELLKWTYADLTYAFIRIRVISTETPVIEFKTRCSTCGETFLLQANFDEMPVTFLDEIRETAEEEGEELEPYPITLSSGKALKFKYLRASDHLALEKMKKKRLAKGAVSDERFFCETLAKRTVEFDGETSRESLATQMYENMSIKDGNRIKSKVETRDFGLDMAIDGMCSHCGSYDEHTVRLDASFFRPRSGGKEG